MRQAAAVLAVGGQCGLVLLSCGCSSPGPEAGAGAAEVAYVPLGWGGPVEAEEVRTWSTESLDAAPRWRVAEEPDYSMVLDSVDHIIAGRVRRFERFVTGGIFLPDGRVVLRYSTGGSTQPDSLLLHFFDPGSGGEVRILTPRGEGGELLDWVSFDMVAVERGFVLVGNNTDYSGPTQPTNRSGKDVWYADRNGRFTRPPLYVKVDGGLLGTFADGSLVMWTMPTIADTTIVTAIVSARATEPPSEASDNQQAEVLFATANRRNPERPDVRASWTSHPARVTVVAGDTIWVIPTERPELVAVHRSGELALKVEWEAGDRSVPPGAPSRFWKGAERFPAAAELQLGADGLLYVRRWEVIDGEYPNWGLEWLVFTQAGDLVARLDIPHWWSAQILQFGHEAVLAVVSEDAGPNEVRIHSIERQ